MGGNSVQNSCSVLCPRCWIDDTEQTSLPDLFTNQTVATIKRIGVRQATIKCDFTASQRIFFHFGGHIRIWLQAISFHERQRVSRFATLLGMSASRSRFRKTAYVWISGFILLSPRRASSCISSLHRQRVLRRGLDLRVWPQVVVARRLIIFFELTQVTFSPERSLWVGP